MSFWRFVTSTELRWSLGLLGFASAPIVCVYQLYVESQAGKISLKDSGTLRELAPEQATPEKEPLFKGVSTTPNSNLTLTLTTDPHPDPNPYPDPDPNHLQRRHHGHAWARSGGGSDGQAPVAPAGRGQG